MRDSKTTNNTRFWSFSDVEPSHTRLEDSRYSVYAIRTNRRLMSYNKDRYCLDTLMWDKNENVDE